MTPNDLAGRHHVQGDGMTRGRMASEMGGMLIWSLKTCMPLPEEPLSLTTATGTPTVLTSTAALTRTRVPTATPSHATTVFLNDPRFSSTEFNLGTAIPLGDPTLRLRP